MTRSVVPPVVAGSPARGVVHLPAAQPRCRGTGRAVAGDLLRHRVRHRPAQPLAQDPHGLAPVADPADWGYRVTQGLHVAAGYGGHPAAAGQALVGLPEALRGQPAAAAQGGAAATSWSGARSPCSCAAGIFELATGLANPRSGTRGLSASAPPTSRWPGSRSASLLVHVAVKLPVIRDGARRSPIESGDPRPCGAPPPRRPACSAGAWPRTTSWLPVSAVAGVRRVSRPVRCGRVSVFGVRSGNGPQGIPINRSASAAGVVPAAAGRPGLPAHGRPRGDEVGLLTRDDLLAMPQTTRPRLPIACVEGWSASGRWEGRRVRTSLDLVGAPAASDVRVSRCRCAGPTAVSSLPATLRRRPADAAGAASWTGSRLALDHGYPCRIIAPDRPGVLQTKWVARLEVIDMTGRVARLAGRRCRRRRRRTASVLLFRAPLGDLADAVALAGRRRLRRTTPCSRRSPCSSGALARAAAAATPARLR